MRRRAAAFSLCVLILALLAGAASPVAAAPGGNSAAAAACENGGYLNYTRSDGTSFKNAGQCTRYGAQGGTLTPVADPHVVVTVGAFDGQYCPVTITLEDAAAGTIVKILVDISNGSQFRPVLASPEIVQDGGLISQGMFLTGATAELLDDGYVSTGVFIPVDYPATVCGA